MARRVKHNEEASTEAGELEQLNALVMGSLVNHPLYKAAALPHRVAAPFYARYTEDMRYGPHVDDPVMGEGTRYRSDIAVTIFLSDPESYAGGELVISTSFGEQYVKYPAGDAVMYPASSRHHVAKVTKGMRMVAVTWVQSLIRDAARRELLYELHQAREKLLQQLPDAEETRYVDSAYVNLVRMWAEL
jgi:PKHD-type hydroxylase